MKNLLLISLQAITFINCQGNSTSTNNGTSGSNASPGDSSWMIVASILVMVMTPAVGFFYGGLVKTKNMISILAQTFAIYAITTLIWTLIGFSLTFGGSNKGVWGDVYNFALYKVDYDLNSKYGSTIPFFLFFFFQTKFAAITPALIIGATAERVKFLPILIFSMVWTILVYCPVAHWNWNAAGWLNLLGTKDFAGGNVIHISAGVSAMAAVLVIRDEIYYHPEDGLQKNEVNTVVEQRIQRIKNHIVDQDIRRDDVDTQNSIVFVVIGTMLLWFGWFGFNGGSALIAERSAILAIVNTNVSPSVTLLVWLLLDVIFKGRPTVTGMCIGVVAGLVGITPAAGFVRVWAGVVIGIGSAVFPYIFTTVRDKYKLFDDRLDVFGCHGIAGIWGGFCLGLFLCDIKYDNTCDPNTIGAAYGNGMQIVYQLFGIISTAVYCFVVSMIIMWVLKMSMRITVSKNFESQGLDQVEFKENAISIMNKRRSVLLIKKSTTLKKVSNGPNGHMVMRSEHEAERMEFLAPNLDTNNNNFPEERHIDNMSINDPNRKSVMREAAE